jgi:polar amino acid transport system permease protein
VTYVVEVMPALIRGAGVTLEITAIAGLLAFVVACAVGVARTSPVRLVRIVATVYVEFFRGTSAFVQIFWVYFALPLVGVTFSPLEAGVIVLGLNVGAYGSEVIRGSLRAIDPGQWEACVALNLSPVCIYRRIIFPQALVHAIAPLGNLLVDLLKGTSLLSIISITELTFAGKQQVLAHGNVLVGYSLVLLIYLFMGLPISYGFRRWERSVTGRLSVGRAA